MVMLPHFIANCAVNDDLQIVADERGKEMSNNSAWKDLGNKRKFQRVLTAALL